jgi:hypothetical protein
MRQDIFWHVIATKDLGKGDGLFRLHFASANSLFHICILQITSGKLLVVYTHYDPALVVPSERRRQCPGCHQTDQCDNRMKSWVVFSCHLLDATQQGSCLRHC